MVKYKKGMAVLQYAILLVIVTFSLVTMNVYLRRSIQAKVKDLTDLCIGREHIGLLDETEYTRDSSSSSQLVKEESGGGNITLSTTMDSTMTIEQTIWSDDATDLDIGQNAGEEGTIGTTPYGEAITPSTTTITIP